MSSQIPSTLESENSFIFNIFISKDVSEKYSATIPDEMKNTAHTSCGENEEFLSANNYVMVYKFKNQEEIVSV